VSARRPREAARPAARARPARKPAAPKARPRRGPSLTVVRGDEHATQARPPRPVGCAIVTVSDTRRGRDDRSGALAHELLERAGHEIVRRAWVHDEAPAIRRVVRALLRLPGVDVVLVTGGTGMAKRDVTPEALAPLVEKPLPGFGEMFRARSATQVGAAAWFSRAAAGVASGRLLVMLPGSTAAVELALRDLLLPELVHAVRLLGRFETGD
jgi:molybdenum cofactor biosynthesis protein B